MDNINVLTIGGSRNIGYFSSIRLLKLGATVTFLLRKTSVFDNDETIQEYVRAGKAKLFQGDALIKEDVKRAWTIAQGESGKSVDFLVFSLGARTGQFKLTKGIVITPPDLVTRSLLNCLETLPTPHPNIITITAHGVTRTGHQKVPFFLKPVYKLISGPLADKRGAEEVLAHCAGWDWEAVDCPGPEVLGRDWKATAEVPVPSSLKNVVVIRPVILTDGACRGDEDKRTETPSSKAPYRVEEEDIEGGWTVSRRDVAHFLVEGVMKHWDEWKEKRVSIAY